ncbi:MAG: Crp/Fnr family transcriptional regulator [Chitinophagaceae bacterium]|nr:Crp/Fnr family transcriptional regulator [Chitinophagaceae bacterium]
MTSSDEIAYYVHLFKGLSPEDVTQLYTLAETRTLKAGDVYIQKGALSQKLALISQGLIRTYHTTDDGEEITVSLRWEQQFLASFDSIIHQKPSRFTYEAMEDTLLMDLDYAAIQPIIDNNPRLSAMRHHLLMQILSQSIDRIESFVLLSPEERYLKLIHENPLILNRVPNKHISTFLGITPVSLSRIRKRITRSR